MIVSYITTCDYLCMQYSQLNHIRTQHSTSHVCNSLDMMTSSNVNSFRVTGPLCGEFTGPRWIPLTKASDAEFDVFFDLRLNKRLSKQWWFETQSRPFWRHCNDRSADTAQPSKFGMDRYTALQKFGITLVSWSTRGNIATLMIIFSRISHRIF